VSGLLSFPNPVNEKAARTVAGLVAVSTVVALVTQQGWLLWLLALGFGLRVASGPRFSPFGLLATRVVAPRLGEPRLVPGPPKRFAQTIGLVVSLSAAVAVAAGAPTPGWVLAGLLVVAAALESVFALCLGCVAFGWLQRVGVIPASVCEACNDIRLRQPVG
jgi:hypothetical protein